ncbi:hypothetical protein SLEP1_g25023 [Rubroshorea leprosula]|uniref:RNase H type-1 domain-containing protein n=1 Tax=Rubroshorea leprosula TaxID=152421 RepID=A0AAV5JMX5_9ROSI|nr:hypothetical protein SLEP1_g25023 [Rubroshorea leprosula]
MVHTRATQRESPPRGQGRGQPPSVNPVSQNAPVVAPQHQQTEGVGEHNPQYPDAVASDPVTAQLNAMQQQFGVFQLVLAQLLARDNPVDPLIHLLNPAPPVAPQPVQQPANSPVRSVAPTASQAQSHIPPHPQNPPQSGASDVSKRLDNLEKLLTENRNPQLQIPPISTSIPTPLNTKITQEPYPPGFRMPQFETYDGTKDLDDHLHAFFSIMQAQNASDALMCKMFPSTLRGNALTWYYTLRPNSINAYAELATSFATKFSSRRLIKKTTPELMRITQREGESLKNYMNRFNDAMLEVNAFDEAVGVTAVIQGLNHDRFRDNLIKNTPTTFDEVNQRSLKFIKAEEPNSSTPQMRPALPSWTSFTIPRSQILMQIKNKMEMRRPNPIQSPAASRDHTRYCDFHQDHGHTTEECKSLKSELESLAQKGMLNEYIQNRDLPKFVKEQGQAQGSRAPNSRDGVGYQQAPPPLPPPSRVIHMITGGPEAGGTSSKQQKLYVREVKHHNTAQKRKIDEEDWKNQSVTFTSADFEGVVTPHNDPLVTSVIINNCEVQRALIDTGSAPDIMYYHCFESLGLDPALLQKNLEVYVDDIVVKSSRAEDHLIDLAETFNNLRRCNMKLNPAKCTFGVESGKFLGFMVSRRGIEVNPEKIKAIEEMKPPRSTKDVQRLAGRVAALHRFISKSADKCLPFFKVLRTAAQKNETGKPQKFNWTTECQVAFDELKAYLGSPPLLTKAQEGEILYLYLGIFDTAVSSVLVKETGKQQQPVYYASKVLQGAEQRYSIAEKAALTVVVTARKLRPYFQSHPIIVMTDQPLRQILQKPECSGRLIKWAVELGEFQIAFQQRSTIRAQALADFVVECTSNQVEPNSEAETWTLYVDGSSNNKGSGAGAVLTGPDGFRSEHALKFNFQATNNVAEYEAFLLGLRLAAELKVKRLQVYSDSQLVVNQINSMCEVIDPILARYVVAVSELKNRFEKFQLTKIPRAENEHADSLSKLASENSGEAKSVYIEILNEPSFQTSGIMEISTDLGAPSWTDPIREYLLNGTVPGNKQEEMKLRRKASRYTLVGDILYKRSYSLPLLRCLTPYEAEYALREVHEGVCGNHVGARTVAHKVLRQGYYWPNMQEDAKKFVQRCQKCQFFAHLTHQPAEELTSLTAPWPFAQWGIDLLGPFVKAVGGATHLVVAVDYFTKWKIDTIKREQGEGTRTQRWSSAHEQVDAKILLSGDEQRAEQEFLWWIMYFSITCQAQVMQSISSIALSVIGKHGIPKRSIEVHMTVCELEEKVGEGSSLGSSRSAFIPDQKTRKAKFRDHRTSTVELRACRTSAFCRECMAATVGASSPDHSFLPEHPLSRDLLRQNAPRAFNAVTLLRHVTST